MRWHVKGLLFAFLLSLSACENSETKDRAIKRETDVLDVRLYEGAPNKVFNKETYSRVGFDEHGNESRMLLYFPKLHNLWDKDVIISSIAVVELLLNCTDVEVNPENIELMPVEHAWGPFATWKARDLIAGQVWSTPGGDVDSTLPATTPTLRMNPDVEGAKELSFDITNLVQRMILEDYENYGFVIRVKKSDLNASDEMWFKTSNASDSHLRPSSILTFSTKDSVEQ